MNDDAPKLYTEEELRQAYNAGAAKMAEACNRGLAEHYERLERAYQASINDMRRMYYVVTAAYLAFIVNAYFLHSTWLVFSLLGLLVAYFIVMGVSVRRQAKRAIAAAEKAQKGE